MSNENGLTISQFAASAEVGVETVRFYQRKGLLPLPAKGNGIRRYDNDDVRRLRFIRQAQDASFTLKEIGELLSLDAGLDHERARQLAKNRMADLDNKIADMQRARNSLEKLASACSKGGKSRPCAILSAFDV